MPRPDTYTPGKRVIFYDSLVSSVLINAQILSLTLGISPARYIVYTLYSYLCSRMHMLSQLCWPAAGKRVRDRTQKQLTAQSLAQANDKVVASDFHV